MNAKENANKWLSAANLDNQSRKEIEELLQNQEELEESFLSSLEFGTGGLRGIMGIGTNRVNKYTVGMATQGFANYLKSQFASFLLKPLPMYSLPMALKCIYSKNCALLHSSHLQSDT